MKPRLPALVHLPSGLTIRLGPPAEQLAKAASLHEVAKAMLGGLVPLESVAGQKVDAGALGLEDFHVLRALLIAAGHLGEDEVTIACCNCGEPVKARPCDRLEAAPYLDGELDDDELDEPFPFGEPQAIAPVAVGDGEASEVVLRPVTVGEAMALLEAASRPPIRVTTAIVKAMGIVRLGKESHPGRIARALGRASDEAWGAVVDLFDAATYSPRMAAWVRCDECGARNRFDVPWEREFPSEPGATGGAIEAAIEGFPDQASFEAMVERVSGPIFARMAVRNVGLYVESGVAACDDGGVPLLGSYDPPVLEGPGVPAAPPEIKLYYRTFRAMYAEDGPYDVEAEVRETVEHELEHHLAFLAGDDPEDERERAEIAREARRVVGEAESLRRASRAARSGLSDFLYRTWPLWLIALLGALATALGER